MDPWTKGHYSWHIREVSMVVVQLPEVNPPSVRVPGRGLLMLPILEARRRRKRGEITKKGSVIEGFGTEEIYRRRRPPGMTPKPRPQGAWSLGGSPLAPLRDSESFRCADF